MIVLLSCSINSSSKSLTSSTGRIEQDSITIAISDIRKANAKLIELSYEKDINKNLRQIIRNDSILAEQARDRKSTRLNSSHKHRSRMPSSA